MRWLKPKHIGENYLTRWHLVPRNRWLNVYLHRFTGSDDDRALHCHPWASVSILLRGTLIEHRRLNIDSLGYVHQDTNYGKPVKFPVKRLMYRPADYAHRLELVGKSAWTLFITGPRRHFPGTKVPMWFFHCPNGRKPWYEMTSPEGKSIGGCD